jgi:hypothetical protein
VKAGADKRRFSPLRGERADFPKGRHAAQDYRVQGEARPHSGQLSTFNFRLDYTASQGCSARAVIPAKAGIHPRRDAGSVRGCGKLG